ncbi:hypothetical protein VTO73DRAFT_1779 [Trametes versicolor]
MSPSIRAPATTRTRLCLSRREFETFTVVAGVIPSYDFVARFERCAPLAEAIESCASGDSIVACLSS